MNEGAVSWLKSELTRLESLEGYDLGEAFSKTILRLGLRLEDCVKLNSNENFLLPKEFTVDILKEALEEVDLRLYPVDEIAELEGAIGKKLHLPSEFVNLGNGSDQLIDLLVNAFLHDGSGAIAASPTFSFYRLRSLLAGRGFREISLKRDFSLDVEGILRNVHDTRICFICSPNNPTGNQFSMSDIRLLVEQFPGILVVDEAYAEFAEASVIDWVKRYENLIVLRTFSKAFGVAGARVGYMIADGNLSSLFKNRIQYPYGVSSLSCKICSKLLQKYEYVKRIVDQIKVERSRLIREASEIDGVRAFSSQANFVLIQVDRPIHSICESLMNKGVFVRRIGRVLDYDNCMRVTVGTRKMNGRFLEALDEALVEVKV